MDIAMFDSKIGKQSAAFDAACERFAAAHNLSEVARAIGMDSQMLRNKLNPAQPHRLTVAVVIAITRHTNDRTLIDGELFDLGMTAIELPTASNEGGIMSNLLRLSGAVGQISASTLELAKGGRLTRRTRDSQIGAAHIAMASLAMFIFETERKFAAMPVLSCAADTLLSGGVTL